MDWARTYGDQRVLVTGGAGCIGSNLTAALVAAGSRVIVLDDLSSAERWNIPDHPHVLFVRGNILNEEDCRRAFVERPRIVFHLAALFANQNSVDHPESDLMVNGMGTLRMLQHAHLTGVERFVYASSGCSVYGSTAPLPLDEDFVSIDLDTPYQITKLLGELYGNFFHNFYGLAVIRARFFNVYGPGEIPGRYRNVIPNFIYWARHGRPLPITGTGEETRDFTFVEDIVDGLLRCGAAPPAVGEAFNLASGREVAVQDLAEMINGLVGNNTGVVHTARRSWDHITRRRASVDKAKRVLGYEPRTEIDEGLRRTVAWFGDNWPRIVESARF